MIDAVFHLNAHTHGYVFRVVTLVMAAFAIGVFCSAVWNYLRCPGRRLGGRDLMIATSMAAFALGVGAIQFEAIFLNPDAQLLWGNFLFQPALVAMFVWELSLLRWVAMRNATGKPPPSKRV